MAEYVTAFHLRDDAIKDVKVRAANCAGRHLDDGIPALFNFWIRYSLTPNVVLSMPNQGFHWPSLSESEGIDGKALRPAFRSAQTLK
jgi:hypothetical protein